MEFELLFVNNFNPWLLFPPFPSWFSRSWFLGFLEGRAGRWVGLPMDLVCIPLCSSCLYTSLLGGGGLGFEFGRGDGNCIPEN